MRDEFTKKRSRPKINLDSKTNTVQDLGAKQDSVGKSPSVDAAQQAVENERKQLDSGEESSA